MRVVRDANGYRLFPGDRVVARRTIRHNMPAGLQGTVFNLWPPGYVKLTVHWDNGVKAGLASPETDLLIVNQPT